MFAGPVEAAQPSGIGGKDRRRKRPGGPGGLLHFFYTFRSDGVVRSSTVGSCGSTKVQLRGTASDALVRAGRTAGGLITRRSWVQIPPPPPTKPAGQQRRAPPGARLGKRRSGILRFSGLGRPVFSATPAAVTCAIPRKGYWISPDGSSTVISDVEASALRVLAAGPVQRGDLADQLGLPDTTTQGLLGRLRDHGLVHPEGHGRGATWVLGPG